MLIVYGTHVGQKQCNTNATNVSQELVNAAKSGSCHCVAVYIYRCPATQSCCCRAAAAALRGGLREAPGETRLWLQRCPQVCDRWASKCESPGVRWQPCPSAAPLPSARESCRPQRVCTAGINYENQLKTRRIFRSPCGRVLERALGAPRCPAQGRCTVCA